MKLVLQLVLFFIIHNLFGQSAKFKSNYYYINTVFDSRNSKNESIGNIYISNSAVPKPLFLPGGLKYWVKQNIETSVSEKSKINPYFINLAVDKLIVNENLMENNAVTGSLKFEGRFFMVNTSDSIVLFPFKYTLKYRRKLGDESQINSQLEEKLADVTKRLESWFSKNYGVSQKLARHVKVITGDFTPNDIDADTLYYFQRKLNINDFTSRKSTSTRMAAAVFTGLAYQSDVKMSNDTILLNFKTKVYQIKGMSWVMDYARDLHILPHEQTHFDITQLVAEKFKEKLREEALPAQDFDSRIQYLFIEYFRNMNSIQKQYDNETQHGINKTEQAKWENKIKEDLGSFVFSGD